MMFGGYPCCNGTLAIALPDGPLPRFAPEECPHCGAKVWHRFARLNPASWTEDDFLKMYEIDPKTKTLKQKEPDATN